MTSLHTLLERGTGDEYQLVNILDGSETQLGEDRVAVMVEADERIMWDDDEELLQCGDLRDALFVAIDERAGGSAHLYDGVVFTYEDGAYRSVQGFRIHHGQEDVKARGTLMDVMASIDRR